MKETSGFAQPEEDLQEKLDKIKSIFNQPKQDSSEVESTAPRF